MLAQGPAAVEELGQRLVHAGLALLRRQVQELHILLVGAAGLLRHQRVVGAPIGQRRIQVFAVNVAGKGPRLAHQPVDDVPVVDVMLVLAPQARHPLHQVPGIPDLDLLQADACLHLGAQQAGRHRVGIVFDPNRTAAAHDHALPFQALQPTRRQGMQVRQLLGELGCPARIAPGEHIQHQGPVRLAAGKIPAATQQQRLLHGRLEMPMRRLHIAILMAAGRVGRLRLHPVMTQ